MKNLSSKQTQCSPSFYKKHTAVLPKNIGRSERNALLHLLNTTGDAVCCILAFYEKKWSGVEVKSQLSNIHTRFTRYIARKGFSLL